jgi:tetratricopeptide (TPR) repeat protein|tara:strand:+ start:761 stop:1264 length:504 start_codon:yes stop_codon:yes gene_type:complete
MIVLKKIFIILVTTLFLNSPLYSASSGGDSDNSVKKLSSYKSALVKIKKAKKYEKKGKTEKAEKLYKQSLNYLIKANKVKSADPDTLNYLGFVNRKLGNFEDAEIYYLLGLDQDPNHIGINEYLGELYVITKRIDKAKERLEILKSCNCEEYNELKGIIEGTKKSKY